MFFCRIFFYISLMMFGDAYPQFGFPRDDISQGQESNDAGLFYSNSRDLETFKESTIKLRWLNSLTMQVIWPNQQKDLIFLTEMGNHFCEFSGNFEHKYQAKAFINGCINGEQTNVNIELPNEPMTKLVLKNGQTFDNAM